MVFGIFRENESRDVPTHKQQPLNDDLTDVIEHP